MQTYPTSGQHPVTRLGLLFGLLLITLLIGAILVRYPVILSQLPAQSVVYLTILAALLAFYGWMFIWRTTTDSPSAILALRQGSLWGIAVGLLWVAELWAGNLAIGVLFVYYGATGAVLIVTTLGAALAARQTGRVETGIMTGVWSGLVSPLIMVAAGLLLPLVFPGSLQHDAKDMEQFLRSGLPDLQTYDAGESLSGMINHLWIGPFLGLTLGALGGAIGKSLRR